MAGSLFDAIEQTAEGAVLRLPSALTADALRVYDFSGRMPPLSAPITIDGASVQSCDSTGAAVLVWLLRCCLRQQNTPRFVHLPPAVLHLLDLYDLHNRNLIFNAGTTD